MPFSGGSGGDGTSGNPYQLANLTDLQSWDDNWASVASSYFILTADIDASATSTWNSGAGWIPVGNGTTRFSGNFDGQGYAIDGVYVYRNLSLTGFFGASTGSITNLNLTSVNITTTFTGTGWIGGVIGSNGYSGSPGTMQDCSVSGSVTGNASNVNNPAGGLAGINVGSSISKCYSSCTVSGNTAIGGFVGRNTIGATITNCYATGNVTGTTKVGGFCGYLPASGSPTITNCYSVGAVSGSSSVGGFCGTAENVSNVIACFYDSQTSGQSDNDGRGTPKTTTQMRAQATFTGWDFTGVWDIDEGVSYPVFIVAVSAFISSVVPSFGPVNGGTTVVIYGNGLTGATAVTFDGVNAASFTVDSDTQITAVTPSHVKAVVDVVVTVP